MSRKLNGRWNHLGGSVFEHESGMRIHLLGTVRLADGKTHLSCDTLSQSKPFHHALKLQGYNRRRAIMSWATTIQVEK